MISLLVGLMFGSALGGLLIGLTIYVGWTLGQIHRIESWVISGKTRQPPELQGIYGYLVERITRQNQKHRKERKKFNAEFIRQRDMIDQARDSVILTDADGRINWFNRQARHLFKLRDPEDVGLPLINILRDPAFLRYMKRGKFAEPITMAYPPQSDTWVEVGITRYKNQDQLIMVRDHTRLRRLENMRRDFIANLSHELRTPLTVLRGYLETLQVHPKTEPEFSRIYLEMSQQSARMGTLLKDLITLSRLESADTHRQFDALNLGDLIQRVVQDARNLDVYMGHIIEINGEEKLMIRGVESELYSAFGNLVFNAVRHTPANTRIQVSYGRSRKGLRVVIEDNGPGIETRHLSRLTERFYRIDAGRSSDTGGTGLGLAIVKHALASHGARLHIKSVPGQGSSFSCVFSGEQLADTKPSMESDADIQPAGTTT